MSLLHVSFVTLFVVAYLLYQIAAPSLAYLKRLDGIIKRGRVKEMVLRPGRPTELAHLDGAALERATNELAVLGFVAAGDYVSFSVEAGRNHPMAAAPIASPGADSSSPPPPPNDTASFLRVFLHEDKRCVAKLIAVSVISKTGRPVTIKYVRALISFADAPDGGVIWSYGTSDSKSSDSAAGIKSLFRRPRALATRLPGARLPDLWRVHLARREEVARAANLQWNRASLREALEAETRANHNIRAAFAALTPLKMAWKLRRFRAEKNKTEWLGELAGKLPPLAP